MNALRLRRRRCKARSGFDESAEVIEGERWGRRSNHSTVYRRISAIEDKTGVRFFERMPHGYAMTEAGEIALRYAERVESEIHALGREVLGQDMRLEGKVRVTAPVGLAIDWMPRLVAEFRSLHPDVTVEVVGNTAALDLARREADLAIRATRTPPDVSLARKVCDFRFAAYGSPDYLAAHDQVAPEDNDWCFIRGTVSWLVPGLWKRPSQAERRVVFSSDSTHAVQGAAAVGVGLTLLPFYMGDADTRLVRAAAPVEALTVHLWILTHPDLRHTARVKALRAFLYEALVKDADLFAGERASCSKVWYRFPS